MKNFIYFIKNNLTYILISLFIAIYFELYREVRIHFFTNQYFGLLNNEFDLKLFFKLLLFFIVSLFVLLLLDHFKNIFKYVDKYRYVIGFIIIIICTLFELNGSSIASYHTILGNEYNSSSDLIAQGTLLGIPRKIRSDEYLIFTPFNISQEYNNYEAFSDILRGSLTDVNATYANPSFSLASLFRPFLWGYILFGSAKGLAFYWSSRTVFLFLISYEFGKILTRDKKVLSVAYASLITFSQTIQWWYSINALIEMFIFGQLAIILLFLLLKNDKSWAKILVSVGLIGCVVGYFLTYYPAWQIPLAYIFGVLALFVLINNRKKLNVKSVILLIVSAITSVALFLLILYNSIDAIQATMNTAYPGKRVNTGGGTTITQLFYYTISIFTPIDDTNLIVSNSNVCELSVFYSMFPLGIIASIYSMIRNRKADLLYILLIAVELLFLAYCYWGFPETISKITLLSNTFNSRVFEIIGFVDILLIIRVMSINRINSDNKSKIRNNSKAFKAFKISLAILLPLVIMQMLYLFGLRPILIIWIMSLLTTIWITYLILQNTAVSKEHLAISLICIITLSGLCINPLQKGINIITDKNILKQIKEITHESQDALWVVVSNDGFINNLPIMVGAKTINSTNTYPNMELWKRLDPDEKESDIYNRYAQIYIDFTNEKTSFELVRTDTFKVNLNYNDINKLNISYILSVKPLDENYFRLIGAEGSYYIYECL